MVAISKAFVAFAFISLCFIVTLFLQSTTNRQLISFPASNESQYCPGAVVDSVHQSPFKDNKNSNFLNEKQYCIDVFNREKKFSEKIRLESKGFYRYLAALDKPNVIYTFDPWEPEVNCLSKERIGGQFSDGGKWMCYPDIVIGESTSSDLVFSIGSSYDAKFESHVRSLNKKVFIHTFDPTLNEKEMKKRGFDQVLKDQNIVFHLIGLAGNSTKPKMQSFSEMLTEIGTKRPHVPIFKIDCEGCEYESFPVIFEGVRNKEFTMDQILVELHLSQNDVKGSLKRLEVFFNDAFSAGFYIFSKERNHWGCNGYKCVEYSLMHESLLFRGIVKNYCPKEYPQWKQLYLSIK